MTTHALIVGAGLAGLSAAIRFTQMGVIVTLVERSEALADGASIGITARAVDALQELGVLEECVSRATVSMTPVGGSQWGLDGSPLDSGLPPFEMPPRPDGLPAAVLLYRPELADILHRRAAALGADIRRPLTLEALKQRDDRVTASFSDGSRQEYDFVVAADGVGSRIRPQVVPGAEPTYAGAMSFRLMLHDFDEGQAGFYHSEGRLCAVSLLPGRRTYLATSESMPRTQLDQREALRVVESILERYTAPYLRRIHDRLVRTIGQEVIVAPYQYLLLPGPWHRGRIVLIGDAAHATTPHLSSGGGMALEDGIVLAQEYERAGGDVDAAFTAFAARRTPRVTTVVESSVALMRLDGGQASAMEMLAVRMPAMAALADPY